MTSSFTLQAPPRGPLDGLRLDIPAEGVLDPDKPEPCPAWITLQNMLVSQGRLVTRAGAVKLGTTPDAACIKLIAPIFFQSGATANLVVTTKNAYVLYPNGQLAPVTPSGAINMTSDAFPEIDFLLGKYWVLLPGVGLFSFDGVSNLKAESLAPGIPTDGQGNPTVYPRHLVQFAQHLIVANFDGPNTGVDATNSYSGLASGNVGDLVNGDLDWNVANVDSEATTLQVPYKGWPIQRMMELGSGLLAIYKKLGISNAWYNGSLANEVYNIPDPQVTEHGLQAAASLIDRGAYHEFVGDDDLYVYDSNEVKGIGRRVWQAWMAGMNAGAASGIYSFDDRRSFAGNILHAFRSKKCPAGQSFDQAMVWNYLRDSFSQIDWPYTAVGFMLSPGAQTQLALVAGLLEQGRVSDTDESGQQTTDAFEDFSLVCGDDGGNLWLIDGTQPLTAPAVLETGDHAPAGPDRVSIYNGIGIDCPSLTGSPLQVYVSTRERIGDPVVYPATPTKTYVPGQRWVNFMAAGVWTRFKFVKADGRMDFRGWAFSYKDGGAF